VVLISVIPDAALAAIRNPQKKIVSLDSGFALPRAPE
jgi:hypothetical protein